MESKTYQSAEKQKEVIEAARDLAALWKAQRVEGLPRAERNAAIEGLRERLISAVEQLDDRLEEPGNAASEAA